MMTLYAQQSSAENEHTGFCLFCPLQLRPLTCGFLLQRLIDFRYFLRFLLDLMT